MKQLDKISPLMCTFLTDLPIFQTEPLTKSKSIKTSSFNFLPRHEQTANAHGCILGTHHSPLADQFGEHSTQRDAATGLSGQTGPQLAGD